MRRRAVDRVVEDARADPAVLAVMLFGSAARGEATAASDLDVCLVLAPTVTDPLEHRLRYLGRHDLDLQVFQALPLPVRSRVLKEGRVLFVRDEDALYEIAFRTIKAYEDFKHIHRMYLDAVLRDGS
ncbi:MAG: nucleotidyltransferase domain-containing protein [Armatimonadota bacterium]|nr:nucleotidyltransferase domain-containing protein [Armatimonadota bacterium]MDR7421865.1 nucleotidyltransferase domain-containing protein [Armatimonadota bacterium]MDR7452894.1 nucleotidyltransferase domain-containing protein [Armatimonadota bacterium]MDR7456204.1 nucleotidyltransferase domain-containing protein [Armatimonadota bacterium]MDR7496370.1 nucleotidyltransferase domain-containing protein [Armatimonadota bacterium]